MPFILEKPSKLMPISSGKGEAMHRAPIKKVIHLKYLNLSNIFNLFAPPFFFNNSLTCLPHLSFINLKIIKSPTTAPKAPKRAVVIAGFKRAISLNVAADGAAVKIEVIKIPATKLPKNFNPKLADSIFIKTPVFAIIKATTILAAIINKSFLKFLFIPYHRFLYFTTY